MDKVAIKEISLNVKEVKRIVDIIYKELKHCIDTQIFIDQLFLDEIKLYKHKNRIFKHNYIDSECHYRNDEEMKFALHKEGCQTSEIIARIHLVSNCSGYLQVSLFFRDDVKYRHHLQGLKQILFIHAKK